VTPRTLDFLESATEEIVFMTVSELRTDEITDHLRAASERGVAIKLATMSRPVEDGLREALPEGELFDSLWEWSDTPAGRLLMVDERKTLVSVLGGSDGSTPERRRVSRSGGAARRTAWSLSCGRCSRDDSTTDRTAETSPVTRILTNLLQPGGSHGFGRGSPPVQYLLDPLPRLLDVDLAVALVGRLDGLVTQRLLGEFRALRVDLVPESAAPAVGF